MNHEAMRIGQVATQAGVNIQTLRYYERRGLLKAPDRQPSGYRAYPPDTVRLIRFIKRAQELGFTLDEIGTLLRLRAMSAAECQDVFRLAQEKVRLIDTKIVDLRAIRARLAALMRSCSRGRPVTECPIIESFERENNSLPVGSPKPGRGRTAAGRRASQTTRRKEGR